MSGWARGSGTTGRHALHVRADHERHDPPGPLNCSSGGPTVAPTWGARGAPAARLCLPRPARRAAPPPRRPRRRAARRRRSAPPRAPPAPPHPPRPPPGPGRRRGPGSPPPGAPRLRTHVVQRQARITAFLVRMQAGQVDRICCAGNVPVRLPGSAPHPALSHSHARSNTRTRAGGEVALRPLGQPHPTLPSTGSPHRTKHARTGAGGQVPLRLPGQLEQRGVHGRARVLAGRQHAQHGARLLRHEERRAQLVVDVR